jgi:hypothetical protein
MDKRKRCTTHYDPVTGHTIGAKATVLANYYQCLKDTDCTMKFANIGAGIGGGFENTLELKPMKYEETKKAQVEKPGRKKSRMSMTAWSKMMCGNQ